MKALTTTVPRYVFAIVFIIFGLLHFIGGESMAGMVPIPGGAIWVYITGVAMLAAGVSFIIKKYDYLAGLLLAALLVIYVLSIHLPSLMGGNEMSMSQVLKDLALAAGALMVANDGADRSVPGQG